MSYWHFNNQSSLLLPLAKAPIMSNLTKKQPKLNQINTRPTDNEPEDILYIIVYTHTVITELSAKNHHRQKFLICLISAQRIKKKQRFRQSLCSWNKDKGS